MDWGRADPSSGSRMKVGARKIMASAAQREVGEDSEIELLTWGMWYAQRGKKKKRVYIIACKIRAILWEKPGTLWAYQIHWCDPTKLGWTRQWVYSKKKNNTSLSVGLKMVESLLFFYNSSLTFSLQKKNYLSAGQHCLTLYISPCMASHI